MNFYSVLNDSDEEETPKPKVPAKTDSKDTKKPATASTATKPAAANGSGTKSEKAPAAAKDKATAPKSDKPSGEKRTKDSSSRPAAAAAADAEVSKKEISAGNRESGHGRKQVRENKGRSGKGKNGVVHTPKDRRSTSEGNSKHVPKDGAGAGNWGGPEQEIRNAVRNGAQDDDDDGDVGADAEEGTPDAEPAAPATPTYTLDEYMAMRSQKIANKDAFAAVSERKVETSVKVAVVANSADEDYFVLGGMKELKISKKEKKKETLALDFSNAALQPRDRESDRDRDNDRSGRAGRGGRGDRSSGRGGGRSPGGGAKIDIMDKSAFPSL